VFSVEIRQLAAAVQLDGEEFADSRQQLPIRGAGAEIVWSHEAGRLPPGFERDAAVR
jgi:hypothetical protein